MQRHALDFLRSHSRAWNKWKKKKLHRLPGIYCKQEITLSHEPGLPKSISWDLPARVHLGGVSSRPHPFSIETWFTKGLAFSSFMYHGWNAELGEVPLEWETARSFQPSGIYNFVSVIFYFILIKVCQWKITSAQRIGKLWASISCPVPAVSVYMSANQSHFQRNSRSSSIPVRVPYNSQAIAEKRGCGRLSSLWHFIYVALKPWKPKNESPLWLGSLVLELEAFWKSLSHGAEGTHTPIQIHRSSAGRKREDSGSWCQSIPFRISAWWLSSSLTASFWLADLEREFWPRASNSSGGFWTPGDATPPSMTSLAVRKTPFSSSIRHTPGTWFNSHSSLRD